MRKLWLLVLLVGCPGPKIETDCQMVRIVTVSFNKEVGIPDWKTNVMFPDSTVRWRYGEWGKKGDRLCARKSDNGSWY